MKNYKTIPLRFERVQISEFSNQKVVAGTHFSTEANELPKTWRENTYGTLSVMESGLVTARTAEESLIYSSGMLVYIPPGLPYRTEILTKNISGWYVTIPKERVGFLPSNRIQVLKPSKLILGISDEIVSWGILSEKNKTPVQRRLVMAFLDELAKIPPMRHLTVPMPAHSGLCIVAGRIMQDPADKKGIDFWAKVAGMSRRSFTGYFSSETGLSFSLWRQRVKIHSSIKSLLSGKSVTETAAELNYPTTSAFSDTFRRQIGISPKQYLKRETNSALANSEDRPNLMRKKGSWPTESKGKVKVEKFCCPKFP